MKRPSVSLPDEMDDDIMSRREKGSSRSEYIREALMARFYLEDSGYWDDINAEIGDAEPPTN